VIFFIPTNHLTARDIVGLDVNSLLFYLVFDVCYNIHAMFQSHSLRTSIYNIFDCYHFMQEIAKNLQGEYYHYLFALQALYNGSYS